MQWQPAHVVINFADTLTVSEDIQVQPRGSFRKDNCDIASLMLNFKTPTSPLSSNLKN